MSLKRWLLLLLCLGGGAALAGDATRPACTGLAVDDLPRLKAALATGCDLNRGPNGPAALRLAISQAKVDATRMLLDAGADPNGLLADGTPLASWFGSGLKLSDDDLLAVATALNQHHCRFDDRADHRGTPLLVNLAHRRVPKTLAFIASRKQADCDDALQAMAREDDLDSLRVLLECGADPLAGHAGLSSALFAAAAAGRAASVAEMLKHSKDLTDPKVAAAFRVVKPGDTDTAKAFTAAGFTPPPTPARPPPPKPHQLPPEVAQLLTRLRLVGAGGFKGPNGELRCWLLEQCDDIAYVDCGQAADGPAFYLDLKAARLLATCGGACMAGCTNCPPPQWACKDSRPKAPPGG